MMQAGYAAGLLFLCPLGDIFRRRAFVLILVWFTSTMVSPGLLPSRFPIDRSPVAWLVYHEIISRLSSDLLRRGCHHRYSPIDAPSRRGSRTTSPKSHCAFYCRIWTPSWHASSTTPFRYTNPIHKLEKHLLVLFRSTVPYLDFAILLHARLSQHESRWYELLQDVMEHSEDAVRISRPGPSLPRRLLHIFNIYKLLDDTDLLAF